MSSNPHHQSLWSDLPSVLLELILNRLYFCDAACFAVVCKSWQQVACSSLHFQSLSLPWVVVPCQSIIDKGWFFYSPMEAKTYYKNLSSASLWTYLDTSTAWLMMHDDFSTNRMFLLNPLTEKTIMLPSYQVRPLSFTTVVVSSNPSARTCVVAALDEHFNLFSCMPHSDADWFVFTHWWTEKEPIVDIIFFNGLLCAVTLNHKVLVFEFGQSPLPICRSVYTLINRARDDTDMSETIYLVESKGKLLMVIKCQSNLVPDEDEGHDQNQDDALSIFYVISVYELDLSVPRWTEVKDLGDELLLIGSRCSRSIPAQQFSRSGFRRNCIYFTDVDSLSPRGEFLQFCLEDRSAHAFVPRDFPPIRCQFHWIVLKE